MVDQILGESEQGVRTELLTRMEAGSIPAPLAKPELTISQDGHRLFAVMGYTNEKNHRSVAIERLPRHFLKMSEEDQKWFLNSQGIAEKLLKKLRLVK